MDDISGRWKGSYGYGSKGQPRRLYNTMEFMKVGSTEFVGEGSDENDSEITMNLSVSDRQVAGLWWKRTSPEGEYAGAEFRGAIVLLLGPDNTMQGVWIGPNRDNTQIESGSWRLIPDGESA